MNYERLARRNRIARKRCARVQIAGQHNLRCISAKQQYFLLIRVSTYSGWLWEQFLRSSKLGCRAFSRDIEEFSENQFCENGAPIILIWFSPMIQQNDVIFCQILEEIIFFRMQPSSAKTVEFWPRKSEKTNWRVSSYVLPPLSSGPCSQVIARR